jgi:hypothetical protein
MLSKRYIRGEGKRGGSERGRIDKARGGEKLYIEYKLTNNASML